MWCGSWEGEPRVISIANECIMKLKEMYYLCRQDESNGANSGQAKKLP